MIHCNFFPKFNSFCLNDIIAGFKKKICGPQSTKNSLPLRICFTFHAGIWLEIPQGCPDLKLCMEQPKEDLACYRRAGQLPLNSACAKISCSDTVERGIHHLLDTLELKGAERDFWKYRGRKLCFFMKGLYLVCFKGQD